jgi:hypothetical protein
MVLGAHRRIKVTKKQDKEEISISSSDPGINNSEYYKWNTSYLNLPPFLGISPKSLSSVLVYTLTS